MKFRVIRGIHSQYGKVYKAGDVVETDHDLCKLFRNKFTRESELDVGVDGSPEVEDVEQGAANEDHSALLDEYGTDVTDEFPAAESIGLLVRRQGRKYHVIDAAFSKPLHDKPMTKKDDVRTFIDGMK